MTDIGDLGTETWGFPVNGRAVGTVPKDFLKRYETLRDAMDLLVELWPKPGYRTVTIETHQWVKLRKVLLAIPALMMIPEDDDA